MDEVKTEEVAAVKVEKVIDPWHYTHLPKSMRNGKTYEEINEMRKKEYENKGDYDGK